MHSASFALQMAMCVAVVRSFVHNCDNKVGYWPTVKRGEKKVYEKPIFTVALTHSTDGVHTTFFPTGREGMWLTFTATSSLLMGGAWNSKNSLARSNWHGSTREREGGGITRSSESREDSWFCLLLCLFTWRNVSKEEWPLTSFEERSPRKLLLPLSLRRKWKVCQIDCFSFFLRNGKARLKKRMKTKNKKPDVFLCFYFLFISCRST